MGMFDNARDDHERGMHIMGDTSAVCAYCRGEECYECHADLERGEKHEPDCSQQDIVGTWDACEACGTSMTLLLLMKEMYIEHEKGLHAMYTAWCPECEHNARLEDKDDD